MKIIKMVLLALTLTYSVAKADIVLVPDFRVDQDPTPNSNLHCGIASSLAYGYFVVTYKPNNNYQLYARRVDFNGNPMGNAFLINTTPSSSSTGGNCATVAIDTNGNMVFSWMDNRTAQYHTYFSRFDLNQTRINSDTIVDTDGGGSAGAVAALPSGGFVVVFGDARGVGGSVYARIYDSNASPIGSDFRVDQNPDVDSNHGLTLIQFVTSSAAGKIFIAWVDERDYGNYPFNGSIYARIFDSIGIPLGNDFRVDQGDDSLGPVISAAPDGNFLIVWDDYRQEGFFSMNPDVYARAFDPNGTPLGNDFIVNESPTAYNPYISCAPSGRCLVSFFASATSGRRMSSSGTLLDSQFIIPTDGSDNDATLNAPVGSDKFVTVWALSQQVWANITGPFFSPTGVPSLSFWAFSALGMLFFLSLIKIIRTRKKALYVLILLVFLFSVKTVHAVQCLPTPEECNSSCENWAGPSHSLCKDAAHCNYCLPRDQDYSIKLISGDDSKKSNRIGVYLLAEGWTQEQQDIFDEMVKIEIENLKNDNTYLAYWDFFNFYRVNVISPDHGPDILIDNQRFAVNGIALDDEDVTNFFVTGIWTTVVAANAYTGTGYHIASYHTSDPVKPTATWKYVIPDSVNAPTTVTVMPSWEGFAENALVKYTLSINASAPVSSYGNQKFGDGKYLRWGVNNYFIFRAQGGDSIEITAEPEGEGNIIADSMFIYWVQDVPRTYKNTYFNMSVWANDSLDYVLSDYFLKQKFGYVDGRDIDTVLWDYQLNGGMGLSNGKIYLGYFEPQSMPILIYSGDVTFAHEMGHAQGQLYDEHHGAGCADWTGYDESYLPNLMNTKTYQDEGNVFKWNHLIPPESGFHPWCKNPDGSLYNNATTYVPHENCLMDGDSNFGALCAENVVLELYSKLHIIEDVSPASPGNINVYDDDTIIFSALKLKNSAGIGGANTVTAKWVMTGGSSGDTPLGNTDTVTITSDFLDSLGDTTFTLTLTVDDTNPKLVEKHPYCYGWPLYPCPNFMRTVEPYDSLNLLLPETKTWTVNRVSGTAPAAPLISGTTGNITVTNPGPVIIQATVTPGSGDTGIRSVTILYAHSDGIWHMVPMERNGITNDYSAELFEVPEGPVTDNYTYMIQAVGNNGRAAQDWFTLPDGPYTITIAVPDTIPPTINFVSAQADTGNTNNAFIMASAQDNIDLESVSLMVSLNGEAFTSHPMSLNHANNLFEGDAGPFPTDADTLVEYYVRARDLAGNTSDLTNGGVPFQFSVDNVLPHISGTTGPGNTTDINGPYLVETTVTDSNPKSPPEITLTYAYYHRDGWLISGAEIQPQNPWGDHYEFQFLGQARTCNAYYSINAIDKWGNAAHYPPTGSILFQITDDQTPSCWDITALPDTIKETSLNLTATCMDNAWVDPNALGVAAIYRVYSQTWGDYYSSAATLVQDLYNPFIRYATITLPAQYAPKTVCYYIQINDASGHVATYPQDPNIPPDLNYAQDHPYCYDVVYPFIPGTLFVSGEGDIMSGRNNPIYTYNWLTWKLDMFVDVYDILKQTPGVEVDENGIVYASMLGVHAMAYDPLARELYFTYLYQRPEDMYFQSGLGKVDAAKNVEFVFQTGDQAFANPMQDIVFTDSGILLGTIPDPDPSKDQLALWAYDPHGNQSWPTVIFDDIALDGWGGVPLTAIGNELYAPGHDLNNALLLKI